MPSKPSKRGYKVLGALAAVLVLIAAGGAALSQTKYGLFGMYAIEAYLPGGGRSGRGCATPSRRPNSSGRRHLHGRQFVACTLAAYRRTAGLNRELLTRSLLHESLFVVRYGNLANASTRVGLHRDASRAARERCTGIDVALAANMLRNGAAGAARERGSERGSHLSGRPAC